MNQDEASDEFGLMMRNPDGEIHNPLRPHNFYWWDRHSDAPVADHAEGTDPRLFGSYTMPDGPTQGTPVKPAFQLLASACATARPSGPRASPASRPHASAAWRTRWA